MMVIPLRLDNGFTLGRELWAGWCVWGSDASWVGLAVGRTFGCVSAEWVGNGRVGVVIGSGLLHDCIGSMDDKSTTLMRG